MAPMVTNRARNAACGNQQKTLTDLTRFKVEGVVARFVVNREALEDAIQNRRRQDAVCGHDIQMELPQSLPHSVYNASLQGEMHLFHGNITDHTLATELSTELKELVAVSHRFLTFSVSVLGTTGQHVILHLHVFTDSRKQVIHPYSTSIRDVTRVDSIEEEDDGTVRLRIDDDVMIFQIQEEVYSKGEKNVGKDFDKTSGKDPTFTSYPLPFDWGCELLGSSISFCQVLDDVRCELEAVGGDVCVRMPTESSKRAPTSMKIVNMTGVFGEMFPFLAETLPTESFEAELIEREHTTGITYPCLTP